jgi:hypothetical protein
MTYRISGLDPMPFADAEALIGIGAIRVQATCQPGFPCRVTLEDAAPGESLLLVNHVSHDVATPFRSSYAIYVREAARAAATYVDSMPPFLGHRTLGLRGFDESGMLHEARVARPGEADAAIDAMMADRAIAYVDIHNAAAGCFLVRAERYDA